MRGCEGVWGVEVVDVCRAIRPYAGPSHKAIRQQAGVVWCVMGWWVYEGVRGCALGRRWWWVCEGVCPCHKAGRGCGGVSVWVYHKTGREVLVGKL